MEVSRDKLGCRYLYIRSLPVWRGRWRYEGTGEGIVTCTLGLCLSGEGGRGIKGQVRV